MEEVVSHDYADDDTYTATIEILFPGDCPSVSVTVIIRPASAASAHASGTVAASAVLKLDNLPFFNTGAANDEWLVRRTVTSSPGADGAAATSQPSVLGFRRDGTISPRFANNRGVALFTLWGNRPIGARNAPAPLQSGGGATLNLAHSTELW